MTWIGDSDCKWLHLSTRHSCGEEAFPEQLHRSHLILQAYATYPTPRPPVLSQQLACVPVRNVSKPQELPSVVVHSCNPSTWMVEAGDIEMHYIETIG